MIKNKFKSFIEVKSLYSKCFAFTLAETLIVMGIIGVVAALTLPNLNSSTGDKEKVVKVKKAYQNLSDAYGRATAVYGPFDDWFIKDNTAAAQRTRFAQRLTEFMKISKDASNSTANVYTLADGMTITIYNALKDAMGTIVVDIDGNKGKNKMGYDQFSFEYDSNTSSIEPSGSHDNLLQFGSSYLFNCCSGVEGNNGNYECTRWVVEYDNMDYLKLGSDGKCPNGSALNISPSANPQVTSCK